MGEVSGLLVLFAGLGAAFINALFNLLTVRETAKSSERAEYEKYRRERLKERDQLFIEPLRQEIDRLLVFKEATANFYLIAKADSFDDDAKQLAKADLVKVSSIAMRYKEIVDLLLEFYSWDGDHSELFHDLRVETEKVLTERRAELDRLLASYQNQPADAMQVVTGPRTDDGPLVDVARWFQRKGRRWLP